MYTEQTWSRGLAKVSYIKLRGLDSEIHGRQCEVKLESITREVNHKRCHAREGKQYRTKCEGGGKQGQGARVRTRSWVSEADSNRATTVQVNGNRSNHVSYQLFNDHYLTTMYGTSWPVECMSYKSFLDSMCHAWT